MNVNGAEYYCIRNAQGDIIGPFDKTSAGPPCTSHWPGTRLAGGEVKLEDALSRCFFVLSVSSFY